MPLWRGEVLDFGDFPGWKEFRNLLKNLVADACKNFEEHKK